MTKDDIKLYSQQFDNLNRFVGRQIEEIVFYLENSDTDFSEVQNLYGKSLYTGIDIKIDNTYFSIGCRFSDTNYGLTISEGQTPEFEYIEDEKNPVKFDTKIIGQTIKSVDIFWMKIPWNNAVGYYPQEFVINTKNDLFLLSSIEINNGEVDTEFTNELLVIENERTAKQLQLGQYGIGENGREWFKDLEELNQKISKNWL